MGVCARDDDDPVFCRRVVLDDDGGGACSCVLHLSKQGGADVVGLEVGDEVVCDGLVVSETAEKPDGELVRWRLQLGDGDGLVEPLSAEMAFERDAHDGFARSWEPGGVCDEVLVEGAENRDWHSSNRSSRCVCRCVQVGGRPSGGTGV